MHTSAANAPTLTATELARPESAHRLLILVPGLGTDVANTWSHVAPHLDPGIWTIGLDLPGHGASAPWSPVPEDPSMADLAAGVVDAVRAALKDVPQHARPPVHVAGISLAGGLALQLAAHHDELIDSATVVCSAARIGAPQAWQDRAQQVLREGTAALAQGSADRWFAPEFRQRDPETVEALLSALRETDDSSYAALCAVLSRFDLREELSGITVPVLTLSGEHDPVTPPADGAAITSAAPHGQGEVMAGVSHQAPTEKPEDVAFQLNRFLS